MKTNLIKSSLICAAVALALTITAADDHSKMRGGEHMMSMHKITAKAESDAFKTGDAMAMVCTKWKSVVVQNVTIEKGHMKMMMEGEKHLCAGCNNVISVVGTGKGAKDEVKHVCGACGDTSVFCCATKPGSSLTKGMDKEKK